MLVAKPINDTEKDLLIGNESKELVIQDLDGHIVQKISAPVNGWTHEILDKIDFSETSASGWDAFLGKQWIGSSEV